MTALEDWAQRFAGFDHFEGRPLVPVEALAQIMDMGLEDAVAGLRAKGINPIRFGNHWHISRVQFDERVLALARAGIVEPTESAAEERRKAPTPPAEDAEFTDVRGAAAMLGMSPKTILRRVKEGKIKRYEMHGSYRYRKSDLRHYATAGGK